jgi:hypothetical protein
MTEQEPYVPAFVAACGEQALQDPSNPLSWYARAYEYRVSGDVDAWCRTIETVLTMPHRSPEQRWHRAWSQMARNDWSAWTDYEARTLYADDSSPRTKADDWVRWISDAWDGQEDVSDKTILVLSEQGVGDNIQMLRFLAPLADRARSVIVKIYPRLVPFVQCNVDDRVTVMISGVDKPFVFDRHANIMSLPHLIGQLPAFVPLRSPGRRSRLPARSRPIRAGICWAGSPFYGNDEQRSMPVAYLAPLFARPDIEWHTLQVGGHAGDADRYPSLMRPWPPLVNFGETADLIAELDVVVSVDTAVGHLAGCLDIPTFLLLPRVSDQRWGFGDRTPWYPSMQLVRQSSVGDWPGVVSQLDRLLDQYTPSRDGVVASDASDLHVRVLSATH